jgi:hypothetical protein
MWRFGGELLLFYFKKLIFDVLKLSFYNGLALRIVRNSSIMSNVPKFTEFLKLFTCIGRTIVHLYGLWKPKGHKSTKQVTKDMFGSFPCVG